MALGRFRALRRENVRFRGAFASFDEAVAHVRPGLLAGYDHDRVVPVSREVIQQVPLWDYPILYWLKRLTPEITRLVDAGGHIGVKYRAFGPHLDLDCIDWIVYDLPALVKAGRAQARPQDRTLSFVERIEEAPAADVLLASGLMPYLDEPLVYLVRRLRVPRRHILPEAMNARVAGEAPAGRPVGMVSADKNMGTMPLAACSMFSGVVRTGQRKRVASIRMLVELAFPASPAPCPISAVWSAWPFCAQPLTASCRQTISAPATGGWRTPSTCSAATSRRW